MKFSEILTIYVLHRREEVLEFHLFSKTFLIQVLKLQLSILASCLRKGKEKGKYANN